MSFTPQQKQFAVLKIEKNNVKIYSTQTSYSTINVGDEVQDARWAGDFLNITLKSGKVRRYSSQTSYSTI